MSYSIYIYTVCIYAFENIFMDISLKLCFFIASVQVRFLVDKVTQTRSLIKNILIVKLKIIMFYKLHIFKFIIKTHQML